MELYLKIIFLVILFILFVLSSIFSGCETAYTSISPAKVQQMINNKESGHKIISRHIKKYNQTLSTILIANNIVNISASALTSFLLSLIITNHGTVAIVATVVVTPIIVIFGEILPKIFAKQKPILFLKIFGYIIEIFYWLFFVFTYPLNKLSKKVYVTNSENEIKTMLSMAKEEGVLETHESILAQKALDLDSSKISQHYIRLKDVDSIPFRSSIKKANAMFKETNYSRIPVEQNGNLVGIIMLKDIFHLNSGNIASYIKRVPQISANSLLSIGLEKLRTSRSQMAFVTENNTSDKIIGIITIEDIIEELVGEIYDEYDTDEEIYEISLQKAQAKSNVAVKSVFKQLEINTSQMDDENLDLSLREWLLKELHVAKLRKNSSFTFNDAVKFKVLSSSNKITEHELIEINIL
ncbi:CNNM domain-containing protein [Mycoplasmopsis alligatoris]|uniref:CBS domain protein n=1 Tax=Mycoplasmopsis alligatoris A21JP2 TaxID=747682 RepID=D4XUZ3_9BACT|nr:CNNM domain-containing protein [Mycoplasmopsis alligatoris]EFF41810.1 CBS domain protein [Mycoplasmopsis alligatoris A21JP2]